MLLRSNILKFNLKQFTNLTNNLQFIEENNSGFLKKYLFHTSQADKHKCPGQSGSGGGKHQVTYKPYVPVTYCDHDAKNRLFKRPMSPHLQIYGPTVVAMTSITQRITGTILVVYALVLSGSTLFLSNGIDSLISIIQSLNLSDGLIKLLKIVIGLPFGYHYFTGIRFCLWNANKMLAKKEIYNSALIAIGLGVGLSFLFSFM